MAHLLTVKINIRQTMLLMNVNEYYDFPIADYDYVLSCRTRLQKTKGMRFGSSTEKQGFVTITRLEDAAVAV